MEKYKFAYIVEVSVELLTDDKELVQQLEEENGVKVTYDYLETDIGETIVECLEDLSSSMDIAVQPVKHGRWILESNYRDFDGDICSVYSCSVCSVHSDDTTNFCPNCGAKMVRKV